jgi:hypothetical protein
MLESTHFDKYPINSLFYTWTKLEGALRLEFSYLNILFALLVTSVVLPLFSVEVSMWVQSLCH